MRLFFLYSKVIEKASFEGMGSIEAGMAFEAKALDGTSEHTVAKKVEGDDFTIDMNHPLAGDAMNFDIQIVSVWESTEEERTHGHAHTPGHTR